MWSILGLREIFSPESALCKSALDRDTDLSEARSMSDGWPPPPLMLRALIQLFLPKDYADRGCSATASIFSQNWASTARALAAGREPRA